VAFAHVKLESFVRNRTLLLSANSAFTLATARAPTGRGTPQSTPSHEIKYVSYEARVAASRGKPPGAALSQDPDPGGRVPMAKDPTETSVTALRGKPPGTAPSQEGLSQDPDLGGLVPVTEDPTETSVVASKEWLSQDPDLGGLGPVTEDPTGE